MTYLTLFRQNIRQVMDAYRELTGCTQTRLDKIVSGYRTFSQTMDRGDMRAGTYDKIMSRFSAIWPDGADWPTGIDRPLPARRDPQTLEFLEETSPSVEDIHPEWPADKPWPSDIPKPTAAEPTV